MLTKLDNFNHNNRFVLIVDFHNCFNKALTKKFVTQDLTSNGLKVSVSNWRPLYMFCVV